MTMLEEMLPEPIDPAALTGAFEAKGFRCHRTASRQVAAGNAR